MSQQDEPRRLTVEEALLVRDPETRIEHRLAQVESSHADGKLWDLLRDMPSVDEQVEAFRSVPK